MTDHSILLHHIRYHCNTEAVLCIEQMISYDFNDSNHFFLNQCATHNNIEVAKVLLQYMDLKTHDGYALRVAMENNHLDMTRFLLPLLAHKAISSGALRAAVYEQATQCALEVYTYLLDNNPSIIDADDQSSLLGLAASCDDDVMVRVILPNVDPDLVRDGKALQWIVVNRNDNLFDLLLPFSNAQKTLSNIRMEHQNDNVVYARLKALCEKDSIFEQISSTNKTTLKKKI